MLQGKTLAELLMPPFTRYVTGDGFVFVRDKKNRILLAQDRKRLGEWGQQRLADFVAQAMNEKWDRDFGEAKRWEVKEEERLLSIVCHKCYWTKWVGNKLQFEKIGIEKILDNYWKYCPECGVRLLPPEEK